LVQVSSKLRPHKRGMSWRALFLFSLLVKHALALWGLGLALCGQVAWQTLALAIVLWPISGLGVTAGAHRLWTHHSYEASLLMEVLLTIMYSIADQGPIEGWVVTHALHHKMSDTEGDPHNRQAGFWYSHFGWIFTSGDNLDFDQAECHHARNRLGTLVHLHDSVFLFWGPLWSLFMPTLVASYWGDAFNGFLVAGALRWMFVQHVSFLVNSVAHGERDGDGKECVHSFDSRANGIGPRVSILISICALGEGWHDYHHAFPWDYAAAELDALDQWNPTKCFIDVCAVLGLASNRRRLHPNRQLVTRQSKMTSMERLALCSFQTKGWLFFRYRAPVFKFKARRSTYHSSIHNSSYKELHLDMSPNDLKGDRTVVWS